MTEHTSLTELLNDEPTGTAEALDAEPAPEPQNIPDEAPDGPVRDEKGRFASKTGVEEAGPPPDKLPQDEYKAIREEREKRQALEREITALKEQFQSLQQPKEPPAPPPSIWEDEQGYGQHITGQAVSQASFNARLDMSEMLASQAHEDFDDVKAKFLEMAQSNPALAQQALQARHPWEKAYQIAKNAATMAELGATNLDELKAKIRDELMAEMQAQPPASTSAVVPPTLTMERNAGSRSGPAWSGPPSLSELLR